METLLAVIFLAVALAPSPAPAQVTNNVLLRVLRIRVPGPPVGFCSSFTIEVGGDQYLVTASHCFGDRPPTVGRFEIMDGDRAFPLEGVLIRPGSNKVDAVAIRLKEPLTQTYEFEPTANGIQIGQQVLYLGYPFGVLASRAQNVSELAFVKSGVLSAMDLRDADAGFLYVDGQNNPGLSGGPIVFRKEGKGAFLVAGVISKRWNESIPVLKRSDLNDPKAKAYSDLWVRANSGIVIASSIEPVVAAIRVAQQK